MECTLCAVYTMAISKAAGGRRREYSFCEECRNAAGVWLVEKMQRGIALTVLPTKTHMNVTIGRERSVFKVFPYCARRYWHSPVANCRLELGHSIVITIHDLAFHSFIQLQTSVFFCTITILHDDPPTNRRIMKSRSILGINSPLK